ncbi:hypothetical protein BD626DRAFT_417886 [Schizophyllum amplum]|uniref:Uncharacterized protein n=1 Tax=Schizophyllum amplum TaxID=97359 RepID=A0A550BS93_9AGAR|nr:hypothetical protein BD626DRAFT_417886 [Auriculariopsis ampla]
MAATSHPQPRSATTATSKWEENMSALGNALYSIQSLQSGDYSEPLGALTDHVHTVKHLLKKRPLHVLLDPPPDIPAISYFRNSPSRAVTTIAALISLGTLHSIAKDALRSLWPFDDSVWACALRWTAYFLPIHRDHSLDELPYLLDKGTSCFLMIAALRIFESIASLPNEDAQNLFTSSDNNALCSIAALWALWPTITDELNAVELRVFQPDLCCSRTFTAVWNSLELDVAQDLIGTQLLRLVGGREKRVFRILAGHLRTTLSTGERGHAELNEQLLLILRVTCKYEWSPRTLTVSFVAAVIAVLDRHLLASPRILDSCLALSRIYYCCLHSDHFITLGLENGLFHSLVHHRTLCSICSTGAAPYGEESDSNRGTTGGLLMFIGDCLNSRRAVKGFNDALSKFSDRLPPMISLGGDEQAVILIAKLRHALLERVDLEWASVAVCCNPSVRLARARGMSPCARAPAGKRCTARRAVNKRTGPAARTAKYNFLGTMRAKDLHFLVAIARAFIERHYAQVVGWRSSYSTSVSVSLCISHLSERCTELPPGGAGERDGCPYPNISVTLYYHQGDAISRTRSLLFIPRRAPWRIRQNEFRLLTTAFYGTSVSYQRRQACLF